MAALFEPPRSAFQRLCKYVKDYCQVNDDENRTYLHQREAANAVRERFEEGISTALVSLPTGTGKTGVAVLCAYVIGAGKVLVITPNTEISEQVRTAFTDTNGEAFLFSRGLVAGVQPQHVLPSFQCLSSTAQIQSSVLCDLVITNIHKLSGAGNFGFEDLAADSFDLVIVDEAHHYPANSWTKVINYFKNAKKLFLTATPVWRNENLVDIEGVEEVYALTREIAIEQGIIRAYATEELPEQGLNATFEVAAAVGNY
jgi:superfamily II DNA or RNA helicase